MANYYLRLSTKYKYMTASIHPTTPDQIKSMLKPIGVLKFVDSCINLHIQKFHGMKPLAIELHPEHFQQFLLEYCEKYMQFPTNGTAKADNTERRVYYRDVDIAECVNTTELPRVILWNGQYEQA